jgi:hypothetical protein
MDRGWVYQEQFLSRRSLHFTRHELVWVCLEKHACECGRLQKPKRNISAGSDEAQKGSWETIIQTYSKRALTKPSDRLPALAGVAARYSMATPNPESPGRYLCGLWERDLVFLLCWRAVANPLPRGEASEPMPTWSWAAVPGPVTYGYSPFVDSVEVVDARVEYHGESFVGRVKEARLILAGPTVQGTIHAYPPRPGSDNPHHPSCLGLGTASWSVHLHQQIWYFSPDYLLCCSGDHSVPHRSKVTCLVFSSWEGDLPRVFGLILQEVPGTGTRGRPLYRRIGYIEKWETWHGELTQMVFQRQRQTLEII